MKRILFAVVVVCCVLAGAFAWFSREPGRPTRADLNVIVITLDTTRWDRLGAYGAAGAETPNLDRLASEGVLFEQAITSAPLTLPAHSTLFTSLLPPRHGVRDNGGYVLDPAHRTLASVLKQKQQIGEARKAAFSALNSAMRWIS